MKQRPNSHYITAPTLHAWRSSTSGVRSPLKWNNKTCNNNGSWTISESNSDDSIGNKLKRLDDRENDDDDEDDHTTINCNNTFNKRNGNVNMKLWNAKSFNVFIDINPQPKGNIHLLKTLWFLWLLHLLLLLLILKIIIMIIINTENTPVDWSRLAVTQSPVKDHQVTLMWKKRK